MKKLLILLSLAIAAGKPQAQIIGAVRVTAAARQYEKTEWQVKIKASWSNPYLEEDVSLEALITTPSGKMLALPCYYNSGESGSVSDWRARFGPQEKGAYSLRFVFIKNHRPIDTSAQYSFFAGASGKDGLLHKKDNWTLQFDSGRPFRGIGENIGWESRASDDSKYFKELHEEPKYNYEYMLRSLAAHGGNFFRTWVCAFNLPIDWKKASNSNRYTESTDYFNPSAIAKMDRLVDLCDSLHLYMMLTLGPGAYHIRDGGHASSAADFFVNPEARQQYRSRLRYFVARWGYSPAIGAWEFFNEVDNIQFSDRNSPINPGDIVQWHREMSDYLASIDPYKHLITTSISHRDIKGLNSLPSIDINQKHIYKNTGAIPAEIVRYENDFQKPYVVGEYSYEWDWSKDFNGFAGGMDSDFKRGLWYGLFSPTPVLPLSWWWEFFDSRGTDKYISRVRAISDRMLTAGKGSFEAISITDVTPGITAYAVKCGKQFFVYLSNPADSLKKVQLHLKAASGAGLKGMSYDPERETWSSTQAIHISGGAIEIGNIDLPAGTDLILVIGGKIK